MPNSVLRALGIQGPNLTDVGGSGKTDKLTIMIYKNY